MVKMTAPGTLAIISIILIFIIISAGCMSANNPKSDDRTPHGASPTPSSTGIIQTPVTPGTPDAGDKYPGVSSLITPNESNTGQVNIHPPIPGMWSDPFPREETPLPLYVPMILPEGFSYNGGSYASSGSVWLRISNSTTDIIYTQAAGSQYPGISIVADDAHVRQISAHNRSYAYTVSGTQHQLSWNMDGLDFSLTGETGSDALLIIAGSVEPVSDETIRQIVSV